MLYLSTQIWKCLVTPTFEKNGHWAYVSLCTQVAPRCLDFWTKWSWSLCVIPIWWISYNVNKSTRITHLVMYLVTIIKKKNQICRFLLASWMTTFLCTRPVIANLNRYTFYICVFVYTSPLLVHISTFHAHFKQYFLFYKLRSKRMFICLWINMCVAALKRH